MEKQTGLDEQHKAAVQEGSEQDVLPEEAIILQHLQEAPDVLSVRGHQRSFLRCGVLGQEQNKSRPLQVGKAGQAGQLGGRHEAGPSGDSGREVQRQAAPSKEPDKLKTEDLHQTVQLLTGGDFLWMR